MRKIWFLIVGIFLVGCSSSSVFIQTPAKLENDILNSNLPSKISGNVVLNAIEKIQEKKQEMKIYNYSNYDFIRTHDYSKEKIIEIVKTINPIYFEGVKELEVIHTNKQATQYPEDGWYYSDNNHIRIMEWGQSEASIKRTILHELKHHYCLTKERQDFDDCIKINSGMSDGFDNAKLWDYCYHKTGCFLNTPIDEEYRFIR